MTAPGIAAVISMAEKVYTLKAKVSTENPIAVRPVLDRLFAAGGGKVEESGKDFLIEAKMTGPSARDLNRSVLTALRQGEKRTRLRAEWTSEGVTEKFFDYVPKGRVTAGPSGKVGGA